MPNPEQLQAQNNVNAEINANKERFEPTSSEMKLDFARESRTHSLNYYEHIKNSQDTAELGSTSFKSNTEYKRKRNESINSALSLTKQATAYTLEIHQQINRIRESLGELNINHSLNLLEHIDFTPEMMYSNNIRLHFEAYFTLICHYNNLLSHADELSEEDATDEMVICKGIIPCDEWN